MNAIKIIDFEAGQKLIAKDANLLWEGFDYDGLKLDLYGEWDGEDCVIEDVAPAHMRISIITVFANSTLSYLESCCEMSLPSKAEMRQDSRADAYERAHG